MRYILIRTNGDLKVCMDGYFAEVRSAGKGVKEQCLDLASEGRGRLSR